MMMHVPLVVVVLATVVLKSVITDAHMGITILPDGATRIYPRSKATKFDAYRNPNDPAVGVACHGTAKGTPVAALAANATIKATTSYGAGHGGGHCAWYLSTNEQTWYKISDSIDCTDQSVDGQRDDFVVPTTAPIECKDGCTLAWFWSPMLSGSCETYINCFDITIPAAAGGMKAVAPSVTTPIATCVRPNTNTHYTSMFGAVIGGAPPVVGGATATNPTVQPGCATYTVKPGDTLTSIATQFDVVGGYQVIYEYNKATMVDANTIEVGQVLKMPGGDCSSTPSAGQTQTTPPPRETQTTPPGQVPSSSTVTASVTLATPSQLQAAINATCDAMQFGLALTQLSDDERQTSCSAVQNCAYVSGVCSGSALESSTTDNACVSNIEMSGSAIAFLLLWLFTLVIAVAYIFVLHRKLSQAGPTSSVPKHLSRYEEGSVVANYSSPPPPQGPPPLHGLPPQRQAPMPPTEPVLTM